MQNLDRATCYERDGYALAAFDSGRRLLSALDWVKPLV